MSRPPPTRSREDRAGLAFAALCAAQRGVRAGLREAHDERARRAHGGGVRDGLRRAGGAGRARRQRRARAALRAPRGAASRGDGRPRHRPRLPALLRGRAAHLGDRGGALPPDRAGLLAAPRARRARPPDHRPAPRRRGRHPRRHRPRPRGAERLGLPRRLAAPRDAPRLAALAPGRPARAPGGAAAGLLRARATWWAACCSARSGRPAAGPRRSRPGRPSPRSSRCSRSRAWCCPTSERCSGTRRSDASISRAPPRSWCPRFRCSPSARASCSSARCPRSARRRAWPSPRRACSPSSRRGTRPRASRAESPRPIRPIAA